MGPAVLEQRQAQCHLGSGNLYSLARSPLLSGSEVPLYCKRRNCLEYLPRRGVLSSVLEDSM